MPISVEPYKPILVHNDCSIEIAEDGEPLEFSTNFFVPFSVSRIEIQSIVKDAANLLPYLLRVQSLTDGHTIGGVMGEWSPKRTIHFNPPRQILGELDVTILEIDTDAHRTYKSLVAVGETSVAVNITFYN